MIKILFPTILILLFLLIHYLGYRRIVLRLHLSDAIRKFLMLLLGANYLGVLGYVGGRYFFDLPNGLYFLCSLSIGIGFIILPGFLLYESLHLLHRLLPFEPEKREFLKKSLDTGFMGLGAGYLGMGLFDGETTPAIFRVRIDQGRFDRPIRIAQISDLHIGGLIGRDFVRSLVEMINAEKVDLVAITGDLIDTTIDKNREAVEELLKLKSRYGTFYVVGNHEYFHGIEKILEYLRSTTIRVLENSSVNVANFHVVGLYDLFGKRYGAFLPDPAKASEGIGPAEPTLLLMHQPRGIYDLGELHPSLILSGHTHGGQLWPFGELVGLVQPYIKGLHRLGRQSAIYVNRGVGYWGPPMRIGARAEVTIIEWS